MRVNLELPNKLVSFDTKDTESLGRFIRNNYPGTKNVLIQNPGDHLVQNTEEPLHAPVPVFGAEKEQGQTSNAQVDDVLVQNLPDEQPLLAPQTTIQEQQDDNAPLPVVNRKKEPRHVNDDDGALLPPPVLR